MLRDGSPVSRYLYIDLWATASRVYVRYASFSGDFRPLANFIFDLLNWRLARWLLLQLNTFCSYVLLCSSMNKHWAYGRIYCSEKLRVRSHDTLMDTPSRTDGWTDGRARTVIISSRLPILHELTIWLSPLHIVSYSFHWLNILVVFFQFLKKLSVQWTKHM